MPTGGDVPGHLPHAGKGRHRGGAERQEKRQESQAGDYDSPGWGGSGAGTRQAGDCGRNRDGIPAKENQNQVYGWNDDRSAKGCYNCR